jgi:hypothetical protein
MNVSDPEFIRTKCRSADPATAMVVATVAAVGSTAYTAYSSQEQQKEMEEEQKKAEKRAEAAFRATKPLEESATLKVGSGNRDTIGSPLDFLVDKSARSSALGSTGSSGLGFSV